MFEESNKSSMFMKSILFLFFACKLAWSMLCYIVIPHGTITETVDSGCEGNRDATMA
jgi:hypothetical protein